MSTLASAQMSRRKALLLSNPAQAHQLISNSAAINRDGVKFLAQHLDRTKALVAAWEATCPKQEAVPVTEDNAPAPVPVAAKGNGAVKRKGGWPKGVSREARAQQAVQ